MNKLTMCLVAALLLMYVVEGDARDVQAGEGEVVAGGARRLLSRPSKIDGSGTNAPNGADGQYKDTCKNIQFTKADGGRIIADCDTGKDGFVRAALTNVNNCKKGIENNFGKLSCD